MNHALLLKASEILRREAEYIRSSHMKAGTLEWTDSWAKADYDEMLTLARALQAEAE